MTEKWRVEDADTHDAYWLIDGDGICHARGKSKNALKMIAHRLNETEALRGVLFAIGVPNTKLETYERELPICTKEHLISIILKDMKKARDAWGEWGGTLILSDHIKGEKP